MGPEQLCSSGPKGSHTLTYLLDAFVFSSLLRQYPALKHHTNSEKKRKFMLVGEGQARFGLHGHCQGLAPALREHRSPDQRKSQAKGVLALLRQRQRGADTF